MDNVSDLLDDLFRAHAHVIRSYAHYLVDGHLVDEVVSQTFLVAAAKADQIPAGGARGYLLSVARNVSMNLVRSETRRIDREHRNALLNVTAERGQRSEEHRTEVGIDIAASLRRLSAADRAILIDWAWLDTPPAIAAERFGCTRATYYVRLHRALNRLRRAYGSVGPEERSK